MLRPYKKLPAVKARFTDSGGFSDYEHFVL
jgi:hypothetical protein